MKKRILSLFMVFAMIFTMLLGMTLTAFASDDDVNEPTAYNLWVGGEQFTDDKLTVTDANGGRATYNPDTNTLTLNNYTYSGEGYVVEGAETNAAIYYYGDAALNLVLVGESRVTHADIEYFSMGMCIFKGLNVSGNGSLTAIGDAVIGDSCGVYVEGSITINSGNLTGIGGESGLDNYGVYASGIITVSGGSLAGYGSKVTGKYGSSCGIVSENITIPDGGVIFGEADSDLDFDLPNYSLMMLYKQEYAITAAASTGGTITAAGVSKVKYDKNITYTITPDEGYEISAVLVDGKNVGAVSEYTFKRVHEAHTIEAVFEEIKQQNPFTDISENDWYYEDVKYVYENDLMLGTDTEDTTFAPDETLTRAMLVTILWRLEGEPDMVDEQWFIDVPEGQWYSDAIVWAASNGIIDGYGDGNFGPNDEITREQLAAILYRYEQYKGGGFKGLWMFRMDYADLADVSDWAYEAICWLTMNDIYVCREEGELDPGEEATRAETAVFLHRYCEYRNGQEGSN